jgi:L-rhamnose mutarotase
VLPTPRRPRAPRRVPRAARGGLARDADRAEETGWDNYSLFLADDGWLIGYVEARDDYESAQRRMDLTQVNARWQAEMSRLFDGLDGDAPDRSFELIPEIFHLEDQLAAIENTNDETNDDTKYDTKGAGQ